MWFKSYLNFSHKEMTHHRCRFLILSEEFNRLAIDQISHPINPAAWSQPTSPAFTFRGLIHTCTPASRAPDLVPREGQGSLREQDREAGPGASGEGGSPEDRCKHRSRRTHTGCLPGSLTLHVARVLHGQIAACRLLSSREGEPAGKQQPSQGNQPTPRLHLLPGELALGQFLCPLPREPGLNVRGRGSAGWEAAAGPGTCIPSSRHSPLV